MRHLNGNHIINVDGDRATGESDVLVSVELPGGTWIRTGGCYLDVYERRQGIWRFARREAGPGFSLDPTPDWMRP